MLFSVELTFTTQYVARAFFPSSPDSQRNVLVNAASLMNSGSLVVDHALPQCNGSSSDLSMTETDRAGVRSVYGS